MDRRIRGPDEVDLRLLKLLAVNGRLGIRELARCLRRSPSTVAERVKRLERDGLIKGYTALINYHSLGYQVNAITLLQVEGAYIEEVERELAREPNVKAVYDITGEYDIAIIVSFKSVPELDSFIKRLIKRPHIKRSMTSLIFRVVKESPHVEAFLRSTG